MKFENFNTDDICTHKIFIELKEPHNEAIWNQIVDYILAPSKYENPWFVVGKTQEHMVDKYKAIYIHISPTSLFDEELYVVYIKNHEKYINRQRNYLDHNNYDSKAEILYSCGIRLDKVV